MNDAVTRARIWGTIAARGQALRHPGRHQPDGSLREPAQQRGRGEAGHPGEEQAAVAEQVTEPPAGDDPRRVGEHIAADDEFERCGSGAESALQVGDGDVHHVGVEAVQDVGGEHDG
nr:hypothetical protein [Candidatus Frankia alpina]